MLWYIFVPQRLDPRFVVSLRLALPDQRVVDEANRLHKECSRARGRVEDLQEGLVRCHALRDLEAHVERGHLAPCGRIGETVREAKPTAEHFIHGAHDIGDHWPGSVEDAATHLLFPVIRSEE